MPNTTVDLPELDKSLLVEDQEAFLSAVADAKEGRLDTIMFSDIVPDNIPDEGVDGVITRCRCITRKSTKEGEVAYPNLIFQVRVPTTDDVTGFTTTSFYSTREGLTTMIMSMFTRLLGADLEKVPSPNGTDYSFAGKIDYYDALGDLVTGMNVRVKITEKETEKGLYNRMELTRSD